MGNILNACNCSDRDYASVVIADQVEKERRGYPLHNIDILTFTKKIDSIGAEQFSIRQM